MTFRYLSLSAAAALLFLSARVSVAQQLGPIAGGTVSSALPTPSPTNGLQLGDGSVLLHGGASVEGGYDSNVFYTNTAPVASAILRVSPFVELTNTARNGEVPSGVFFDLRAMLTYREYLSSNADVTRLRAFTPTAGVNVEHNSNGTVALAFSDTYARLQDAPYAETALQGDNSPIIRNNNLALAQLRWSPGGGRLQGIFRLTNMLDWFETASLKPGNSMTNEAMVDLSWRWLPKTALYLQVRQGYIVYLNHDSAAGLVDTATKQSSLPLRAVIGIRGLITEKTSIALALGYQNAFYSSGASTGGFLGSTTAAGELVILPIYSTKIAFGIHHDFQNSVVGNFFYDDGGYVTLSHQAVAKLVGQLSASYDHRRYYGLPGGLDPRIDNLIQGTALLDYYLKTWAFAGVSYILAHNQSDYAPPTGGPSTSYTDHTNYTKHQVFARVGLTY